MKESELSRKVTQFGQKRNAFVFNIAGGRYQRPGIPDLFIMHNKLPNKGVWLELKVGDNRLSEVQKVCMRAMQARGQLAMVLRYRACGDYAEQYILENINGEAISSRGSIRELWETLVEVEL